MANDSKKERIISISNRKREEADRLLETLVVCEIRRVSARIVKQNASSRTISFVVNYSFFRENLQVSLRREKENYRVRLFQSTTDENSGGG